MTVMTLPALLGTVFPALGAGVLAGLLGRWKLFFFVDGLTKDKGGRIWLKDDHGRDTVSMQIKPSKTQPVAEAWESAKEVRLWRPPTTSPGLPGELPYKIPTDCMTYQEPSYNTYGHHASQRFYYAYWGCWIELCHINEIIIIQCVT